MKHVLYLMQLVTASLLIGSLSRAVAKYTFNAEELDSVAHKLWKRGVPIKTEESDGRREAPVVAFYHLYAKGAAYEGILTEQMQHMESVGLYHHLDRIYYTTITEGNQDVKVDDPKYELLYRFEDEGEEIYTLGLLQRFCRAYPRAKVLYFHDKGSFHTTSANSHFRHLLDCHTINPQCIAALDHYDTCGLRASPLPHPHYSGNFWWARCEYVKELVDPWWVKTNSTFNYANNHVLNNCLGVTDRYFAETWITSGPNVRPADCVNASLDSSYLYGYRFPAAFDAVCPNIGATYHRYGTGVCTNASTWTDSAQFRGAYAQMKSLERGECRVDLDPAMIERSMNWYGQPPTSYLAWIQAMKPEKVKPVEFKGGEAVRPVNSREIFFVSPQDKKLHSIPNMNTFEKLKLDLNNVLVLTEAQMATVVIGDPLRPM